MSEDQAKLVLQDICESDEDVQKHLQKIRMLSKGYWSEPDAKRYVERLQREASM